MSAGEIICERLDPMTRRGSPKARSVRDKAILAAAKRGASLSEISKVHGVSRERVRQILKSQGHIAGARWRARAKERAAAEQRLRAERAEARRAAGATINALVAGGMSLSRAAATAGISFSKISSWKSPLRRLITAVPRYGRWQADLPERRARAVKLVKAGHSLSAAAKATKVGYSTVCRLAEEAGLKPGAVPSAVRPKPGGGSPRRTSKPSKRG
jgi:transposase